MIQREYFFVDKIETQKHNILFTVIVKQFSDSTLPLKDSHFVGPLEVHAKLLRWQFPDPANERTREERIHTNFHLLMYDV